MTTGVTIENCDIKNLALSSGDSIIPRSHWTWKAKLQSSFYMYPQISTLLSLLDRHFHYVCAKLAAKFPEMEKYQWEYFVLDFGKDLYGKIETTSAPIPSATYTVPSGITGSVTGVYNVAGATNITGVFPPTTTSLYGYGNYVGGLTIGANATLMGGNNVANSTMSGYNVVDNILNLNGNFCQNSETKMKTTTNTTHLPTVETIVKSIVEKFGWKDSTENKAKITEYVNESRGLIKAGTEFMNLELEISEEEAIIFWQKIYNLIKHTSPVSEPNGKYQPRDYEIGEEVNLSQIS